MTAAPENATSGRSPSTALDAAPTPLRELSVDGGSSTDSLGRGRFARRVLQVIRAIDASRGAVIGLEGEWGSGKTWLLECVRKIAQEEVGSTRRVVTVAFNPWMVSGTSGLVECLLVQLAAELGERVKREQLPNVARLAERLIDYASVLGTVKHFAPIANLLLPGSGLIIEAAGNAVGTAARTARDDTKAALDQLKKQPASLSIQAMRRAIEEELGGFEGTLVVTIDDLDRLPPAELAAMVQAVKAVADFPKVVYLLAYDPANAASAIEKALQMEDGRKYLEKIVQIALPAPAVPASKLHAFATQRLKDVTTPLSLAESDWNDLDAVWQRMCALLETPRDVERLRTRLAFVAPELVREINVADLLLVEALQLKCPELIEWIDQRKHLMLKARLERNDEHLAARGDLGDPYESLIDPREAEEREAKEREGWRAIADRAGKLKVPIRNAMAFLFDEAKRADWRREGHASRMRIQSYRQWLRWRHFVRHDETFERQEVDEILLDPRKLKAGRAWEHPDAFLELCQLIADWAKEASACDSREFAEVFVEAASRFGEPMLMKSDFGYGPSAAFEEVLRTDSPEKRLAAVRLLVEKGSPLLSFRIVFRAHNDAHGRGSESPRRTDDRLIVDDSALEEVVDNWLDKAWAYLESLGSGWQAASPFTLAEWIRTLGGAASAPRIKVALTQAVERSPDGIALVFDEAHFGDERARNFGVPRADFFPDPVVLVSEAERNPAFAARSGIVVAQWRSQITSGGEQTTVSIDPGSQLHA